MAWLADHSTSSLKTEGFAVTTGSNLSIYQYDSNGNMIYDELKGITDIEYNHLDLPRKITFSGLDPEAISGTKKGLVYVYDATSVKLEKRMYDFGTEKTTRYAGGFVYADGILEFITQPEGYISPVTTTNGPVTGFDKGNNTIIFSSYDYVFQFVDHLGNVRLSYSDENKDGSVNSSEIIEESNYYPFGLKQKGYNNVIQGGNGLAQNWKFGGKELNSELGLDWYDITARNYDPAIGRWMNLDPLAEIMRRHSPYNYAFDNPIYFMDPDGMAPRESLVNYGAQDDLIVKGDVSAFQDRV